MDWCVYVVGEMWWLDGWINEGMSGWMDGWMNGSENVCVCLSGYLLTCVRSHNEKSDDSRGNDLTPAHAALQVHLSNTLCR